MGDERRAAFLMGHRAVDEAEKKMRKTLPTGRLPSAGLGDSRQDARRGKGSHQRQN